MSIEILYEDEIIKILILYYSIVFILLKLIPIRNCITI